MSINQTGYSALQVACLSFNEKYVEILLEEVKFQINKISHDNDDGDGVNPMLS